MCETIPQKQTGNCTRAQLHIYSCSAPCKLAKPFTGILKFAVEIWRNTESERRENPAQSRGHTARTQADSGRSTTAAIMNIGSWMPLPPHAKTLPLSTVHMVSEQGREGGKGEGDRVGDGGCVSCLSGPRAFRAPVQTERTLQSLSTSHFLPLSLCYFCY